MKILEYIGMGAILLLAFLIYFPWELIFLMKRKKRKDE